MRRIRVTYFIIATIIIVSLLLFTYLVIVPNLTPISQISLTNPPTGKHIWVIVEENKAASEIYNSASAPYINSIGSQFVELKDYSEIIQHAPLNAPPYPVHPSLPNYLALTSGSTWHVDSDCIPCFSSVFPGKPPIPTTLAAIESGHFKTAIYGEEAGTGSNGTLVIVRNLKVISTSCNIFPCTLYDGDDGIDVSDSTWGGSTNPSWNGTAVVHTELTPIFQNRNANPLNTYGYETPPRVGQVITEVGIPFCDRSHASGFDTHSPNSDGFNTCWEIHPVIAWFPQGNSSLAAPNPNIFSELQTAGLTWRVFAESMPSPCLANDSGNYAVRHNPATFYGNIIQNCSMNDLGYVGSSLPTPSVNFTMIIPDVCDDMHSCNVTQGDTYLSKIIPRIMATSDYKDGGIIFVVWDETDSSSNNIQPALIISQLAKRAYVSPASYDHYDLVHTIEYILGIGTMRWDAAAPIINDVWS